MHLSRILTVADLPEHELPVDRVDWVIRGLAKCARTQQHLRPMAANLKNGIQYQGGFSCQVWLLLIGLLMLATWLNEQALPTSSWNLTKNSLLRWFTNWPQLVSRFVSSSDTGVFTRSPVQPLLPLLVETVIAICSSGKFTYHQGKPEQNVLFFLV